MVHGVEGRTPFLDPRRCRVRVPAARCTEGWGRGSAKFCCASWLATAFPQAGAYARKKGFKPPVGAWMAARAAELAPLVAAHPAIAGVLPAGSVRAAFENAGEKSQPAWSLLFAALWHGHHIAGVPAEGDIAEVLREAGRRQA